jgi:16S rRNA G1207 methylase RsmC
MPKPYSAEMPTSPLKTKIISAFIFGQVFEFISAPDIFSHTKIDKGTRLLIDKMELTSTDMVLDLGCGIGIIGIVAATISQKGHVILTDINRRAVNLTKSNLKRNDIKNADARWGNLYEPVQGIKFDAIISNPPVSSGMKIIFQIIEEAPLYLKSKGSLQLVIRKGHNRVYEKLNSEFTTVLELGKKAGYHVYKTLMT